MMEDYDIAVMGNGLAARALLWELTRHKNCPKILHISDDQLFPSASKNSTGLVSLSGIRSGVSHLGDQLVLAFNTTREFVQRWSPLGWYPAKMYDLSFPEDNYASAFQSKHRFRPEVFASTSPQIGPFSLTSACWSYEEEGWLVDTQKYMQWLESEINLTQKCDFLATGLNHWVQNRHGVEILLNNHEKVRCRKIILCGGAYHKLFSSFHEQVDGSKIVAGSFVQFLDQSLGGNSFALQFARSNFIYRAWENSVTIGATSTHNGFDFSIDYPQLQQQYLKFQQLLGLSYPCPNFRSGHFYSGIRLKGVKRTPWWGKVDQGVFAISGLYKNGLSFSLLAAQELVEQIL